MSANELPEIFWEVEKWAGSEIGWELVGRYDNEEEAQAAFDAIKTTTLKNIMRWRRTQYAHGPSADLLNLIDEQDKEANRG